MRSYRIGSFAQGLAYLFVILSLLLFPPGSITTIQVGQRAIEIPAHRTFFQEITGGSFTWVALFGIGALWLVVTAIWAPRKIPIGHSLLMISTAAFGAGYVASTWQLGVGWLAGGLALALCGGHFLALRAFPDIAVVEG